MQRDDSLSEMEVVDLSINLYSFKRTTVFQSTIMTFLTNQLSTQSDLEYLSRFFKQLDTDNDGFLNLQDFEKGC